MAENTKGENIEHQILEAIKEVLRFKDPDTIKASVLLRRLRTILGLKDLASAPDLYEVCKDLADWDAGKFGKESKLKIIGISKRASKITANLRHL